MPKSYWQSTSNRKKFIELIAKKLKIKEPREWGKVTKSRFCELGGASILLYYNGSIFHCLQSLYKGLDSLCEVLSSQDIEWKREWFVNLPLIPKNHWESMENQRKFFEELAVHVNAKNPRDWRKISTTLIKHRGGLVTSQW